MTSGSICSHYLLGTTSRVAKIMSKWPLKISKEESPQPVWSVCASALAPCIFILWVAKVTLTFLIVYFRKNSMKKKPNYKLQTPTMNVTTLKKAAKWLKNVSVKQLLPADPNFSFKDWVAATFQSSTALVFWSERAEHFYSGEN